MSKADDKELEEAINFSEKMLKEYKVFGDLHNPEFEDTEKIYKQIKTVLTELKRLQEYCIVKDKIREKLEELEDMKVDGEVFITAVNFAKKILKELLEEK